MSAPLVINLRDGSVWERRATTTAGIALYVVAGAASGCPMAVMATEVELAERGIVGTADVLPVPVGPGSRTLDVVEDELTGANLSLWEEEQLTARLRLALESAKRGRRELRAQVAALLAERHSTNESLSEAAEQLRADRDRIADLEAAQKPSETYPPALPWAALMDSEDLADFLDELAASAITHASCAVALAEVEATCGRWRVIAEAQYGHNTAPGPDALTAAFVPVQALREDEPTEAAQRECSFKNAHGPHVVEPGTPREWRCPGSGWDSRPCTHCGHAHHRHYGSTWCDDCAGEQGMDERHAFEPAVGSES
jgi:hypothetical protein